MKKFLLTITFLTSALTASQVITGCGNKREQAADQMKSDTTNQHKDMKMDSTQMVFACPMHPDITGKEGDKCSKCGMNLVTVKGADSTKTSHNH